MVRFKKRGNHLPEITTPAVVARYQHHPPSPGQNQKPASHLGILAFETAKTMSRLVSLYKSLSDGEISRLTKGTVRSQGVAFLNSRDEEFLLCLACAERLEDLDCAAASVSRLGKKCNDFTFRQFDLVFTDLKLGIIDFGKLEYGSKVAEKKVQKMEKLVSATSRLHGALETLVEMEVSERKLRQWNSHNPAQLSNTNLKFFLQQLDNQRKDVRSLKEVSLWGKTFDKCVNLMARIVIVAYARICVVFKPYTPVLPSISFLNKNFFHQGTDFSMLERLPNSGESKPNVFRFFSRKSDLVFNEYHVFGGDTERIVNKNRVFHAAGPSTVGGAGLALRYANLIMLAEQYLDSDASMRYYEREALYQMMPENLKALVRTKLSKIMKCKLEDDAFLAAEWRNAMTDILGWLSPMAHDTVKWQMERNVEKTKFDSRPGVLLLQTLHFSDKEKTDAAIAEVLVGLSCIYRFENRQLCV